MSEPPRDPLAEHPLAPDPQRRRSGPRATLELFPTVSETPFGPPGERPAPTRVEAQIPPGALPDAAVREQLEPAPPVFHEHVLAGGEPDGPRAVAFARRVAAGLADLLILALVGAAELAAGVLLLDLRFPPSAFVPLAAFLLLAALVLLVLAPFVWGTTPGMALADLRIRAEDGGSSASARGSRKADAAGGAASARTGGAACSERPSGVSETAGNSSSVARVPERRLGVSGAMGCSASGSRGGSDMSCPASGPEREVLDENP